MMTSALTILVAARQLLLEKDWGQGWDMQDDQGAPVLESKKEKACKFCMLGAINYVVPATGPGTEGWFVRRGQAKGILSDSLSEMASSGERIHMPQWNDARGRTKTQVIEVYDHAIARLSKEDTADGNR